MQRVKGQEIFLNLIVNGKVDDKLGPFLDLEVELRKEIIEGEYIGMTTTYFDDVFKGCSLKAKYHMRNAKMLKLIDMDITDVEVKEVKKPKKAKVEKPAEPEVTIEDELDGLLD